MTSGKIEAVRHVLWFAKSPRGHQPGSFTCHLIAAFQHADPENFARLSQAFPDYGAAMWILLNSSHGVENLEAMLTESQPRPNLTVVPDTEGQT